MFTPTDFMRRAVPWPEAGETGFINLHYQFVPKGVTFTDTKTLPWTGRPFISLAEFMAEVARCNANSKVIKNVFYCLSRQAKHGGFSGGRAKAARSAPAATHLKAIWLDVDVKKPPKGYADIKEAARAVLVFSRAAGIPFPTAMVASGGGLHVYWISDRPLSVDEWRPYAEGLKTKALEHGLRCDAGVTTDPARILRVPSTFNMKEAVVREVKLLSMEPDDIDFVKELAHIPVTVAVSAKPKLHDLSGITMPASFKALPMESLADGIDSLKDIVLNWGLVEQGCPFFADAKATGGKEHAQPLWNLVVLASTFFDDGEALAHELSNGHPTYEVEKTTKMYARKEREQKEKGLGWPSCKKFEDEGCALCVTCAHKGKIKSPLELGKVAPEPQKLPFINSSVSKASQDLLLPKDGRYFVDEEGYICETIQIKGRGAAAEEMPVRLFTCKITSPWAQTEPDRAINFTATEDLDNTVPVKIKQSAWSNTSKLADALLDQGVKYDVKHEGRLRDFFMSWLGSLHSQIAAARTRPFGWIFKNGERVGFAFGGKAHYVDGRVENAALPDAVTRKAYDPCGEIQPWFDALALVTEQKRPHLDIMVLSAFASPIMWATGANGGTFGMWSESATNKSTTLQVALAVWGNPTLTKLPPTTTERSLEDKLGTIECLPAVIDDAQDMEQFDRVTSTVFMVTQGVSRGRMTQAITQREQKTWNSLVCATANNSFHDYMIQTKLVKSNAILARMLEFHVPMPDATTPGRVSVAEAGSRIEKLNHNYGRVGFEYAKWLVANLDYVKTHARQLMEGLEAEVAMRPMERFWVAFSAGILSAADFANKAFGLKFDAETLHDLLVATIYENRQRVEKAEVEGHTQSKVEEIISAFLSQYNGNQLVTDIMVTAPGRQKIVINVRRHPENQRPVYVHWIVEERMLRVNKDEFIKFLNYRQYSVASVFRGLKKYFSITERKVRLGSGTAWSQAQGWAIEIPVPMHHYLEPTLFAYADPDRVPDHVKRVDLITATVNPPEVATGLLPVATTVATLQAAHGPDKS